MITTICKFQVVEVRQQAWNVASAGEPKKFAETIKFKAVCADDTMENTSFSQATPTGDLEIYVTNPAVVGQFEPGSFVYLTISPAAK